MLKVWGRNSSINVQKVLWCCGELGLRYEHVNAGGKFGVVDTPEYAALNPNRKVPTIEDGGFVLWESNAIVRYLAAKHGAGSLWPERLTERADADRWMDWASLNLIPSVNGIFMQLVRTPAEKRDPATVKGHQDKAAEGWALVDQALAGRRFIAGDRLTMGDIPLGAAAYRWSALEMERPRFANLQAWYGRLTEREPFRSSVMLPLG